MAQQQMDQGKDGYDDGYSQQQQQMAEMYQ